MTIYRIRYKGRGGKWMWSEGIYRTAEELAKATWDYLEAGIRDFQIVAETEV